jgi:flagellar basal-body rod modification protein FlgD
VSVVERINSLENLKGMPSTGSSVRGSGKSILSKDDFLKLLITQLNYQDPLSSIQSSEFASQLAQFSTVEQLYNINSNILKSIDASYATNRSITNALVSNLIGKSVAVYGDALYLNPAQGASFGYELKGDAKEVEIRIYDASGNVIRSFKLGEKKKGRYDFVWDGKDSSGRDLPAGTYTIKVSASDKDGKEVAVDTYIFGVVEGVRYKQDGAVILINGVEYNIADIVEIKERKGNGN